jgi:hypothetical protein
MNAGFFDNLPTLVIFVGIALLILLFNEAGLYIGGRARKRYDSDAIVSQGPLVGGLLGMLAFVLAFTFSMAASHHDQRRKNVLQEANVIGTANLRADLLPAQQKQVVKRLLREYLDVRLRGVKDDAFLAAAIERSIEIHQLLWVQVLSANKKPSLTNALVTQSINDVIDMHQKRINDGLYTRIPGSIWVALFVISAFTMVALGVQIGLTGAPRLVAIVPLSLAFAVLATLVVDLDRPQSGLIKVGQEAMEDIRARMNETAK